MQDAIRGPIDQLIGQLLRTSTEHAVIVVRPDGVVRAWLGASERLFGYTADEAVGMELSEFFTPEDRALGLDQQEIAVAARTGHSEDDRWHLRKDGSRFWASGMLGAMLAPDKAVLGYCKVVRDRTDLRAQINWLRNRVATLEQERAKRSDFLISLGHELRTPLGCVQNALSILSSTTEPGPISEACTIVRRQLPVMERLVEDLTEAGRAAGLRKARLRLEQVVVQEALEDAVASVRASASEKSQELSLTLPPVPFSMEVDPQRLQQMLVNLLVNAIKFTQPGGRIDLSATIESGMAVLRVKDNGAGIEPEILPEIFELFSRGEAQTNVQGLGVGLAVVKELAALHGGGVEVRSAGVGKGSVFTLRLPLAQAPAALDRIEGS